MRLVVAITGGSGVIYAIKTLEALQNFKIETHLIVSRWGERNISIETEKTFDYVKSLATTYYNNDNMAAATSSGSFKYDGMLIVPCSMKTLSSIANGYEDNLISRSAGVCIKESRRLVIVPRETPLSKIHLANMIKLAETGAVLLPAMPGFYHKPKSIDELIAHVVGKILDQFGIEHNIFRRWGGRETSRGL
ncbi:MAG TPA: UbiX family flavin prenyltransferase [Nitrososphaeraceae archaeon]|jgi:4-hydroxy-3-polyprenylbenzoate decarboxylase|nr:UbiX family flavin prenyltransferase [Nitrososphaeraceae archaeon]